MEAGQTETPVVLCESYESSPRVHSGEGPHEHSPHGENPFPFLYLFDNLHREKGYRWRTDESSEEVWGRCWI